MRGNASRATGRAALAASLLAAALLAAGPAGVADAASPPASHPPVARAMAGVWLPDGRRSERLPRDWPFTDEARAAAEAYQKQYGPIDPTVDDANASCIPESFPYAMRLIAQYPFELLFTPGRATLFHEIFGNIRRIDIGVPTGPTDPLPTAMGTSVGRWDGETLVVETTRVRKDGYGRFSGNPPVSNARRFVERITLGTDEEGRRQLRNEITIHDPAVLTRPVVLQMRYKWSPDIEVGEYLCQQDIWDQNVQGSPSSVPWRQ
jgi:hypothetical protein